MKKREEKISKVLHNEMLESIKKLINNVKDRDNNDSMQQLQGKRSNGNSEHKSGNNNDNLS